MPFEYRPPGRGYFTQMTPSLYMSCHVICQVLFTHNLGCFYCDTIRKRGHYINCTMWTKNISLIDISPNKFLVRYFFIQNNTFSFIDIINIAYYHITFKLIKGIGVLLYQNTLDGLIKMACLSQEFLWSKHF